MRRGLAQRGTLVCTRFLVSFTQHLRYDTRGGVDRGNTGTIAAETVREDLVYVEPDIIAFLSCTHQLLQGIRYVWEPSSSIGRPRCGGFTCGKVMQRYSATYVSILTKFQLRRGNRPVRIERRNGERSSGRVSTLVSAEVSCLHFIQIRLRRRHWDDGRRRGGS